MRVGIHTGLCMHYDTFQWKLWLRSMPKAMVWIRKEIMNVSHYGRQRVSLFNFYIHKIISEVASSLLWLEYEATWNTSAPFLQHFWLQNLSTIYFYIKTFQGDTAKTKTILKFIFAVDLYQTDCLNGSLQSWKLIHGVACFGEGSDDSWQSLLGE